MLGGCRAPDRLAALGGLDQSLDELAALRGQAPVMQHADATQAAMLSTCRRGDDARLMR